MYAIRTVSGTGITVYPEHDTVEDLWLEIERWGLDDNHHTTLCKTKEDYQEWLEIFDEKPTHTKMVEFPCWITESRGEVDFETTKSGLRDFLWEAHFHDAQKAEIVEVSKERIE